MSFPSPAMEEPKPDAPPPQEEKRNQADGNDKPKPKKKHNRFRKNRQHSQSSQLSSSSLNSVPSSSVSSKVPNLADADTMSTASLGSSKSSRRRSQGGRKNRSKQHIALQQSDLDKSQATQPPLEEITEKVLYGTDGDVPDISGLGLDQHPNQQSGQEQTQQQGQQQGQQQEQQQGQKEDQHNKQSGTGIRSFNLRRSDPEGGMPVKIKSVKNDGKSPPAQSKCFHCGQSKPPSPAEKENSQPKTQPPKPPISVKRKTPDQKESEGAEEGEKEEGKKTDEERKGFSIKLDLNVELEIALKAKVKGEVMITFME